MLHSLINFILRYFRFILVNMNAKSFLFFSITPFIILNVMASFGGVGWGGVARNTQSDAKMLSAIYNDFATPFISFPNFIFNMGGGFWAGVLGFAFLGFATYAMINTLGFIIVIIGELLQGLNLKLRGLTKEEWEEKEEARKALWDKEKVRPK